MARQTMASLKTDLKYAAKHVEDYQKRLLKAAEDIRDLQKELTETKSREDRFKEEIAAIQERKSRIVEIIRVQLAVKYEVREDGPGERWDSKTGLLRPAKEIEEVRFLRKLLQLL